MGMGRVKDNISGTSVALSANTVRLIPGFIQYFFTQCTLCNEYYIIIIYV